MENPPPKRMTIDEIAKHAYVSRSVVSRVLNNRPNVSAEARARVLKVIKEFNYTPNATARSLATHRSYEVCILAPRKKNEDFANGFWSLLFLGLSEACAARGYYVSFSTIAVECQENHARILYGHNFDGYVLCTREVADCVVPAIQTRSKPVVLIGHDPAFPDIHSVDVDNVHGAWKATRHLIDLGHRRIATILGTQQAQESQDRMQGYLQAHREADIPVYPAHIVYGDFSQQSGYELMVQLLQQDPRPTAVFCANDAMATGAILAITKAGLSVPEDVAVVGYDDLPMAQYICPPLTTIHQPVYRIGREAAAILIDLIEEKEPDGGVVHRHLPTELVVRESCGTRETVEV